MGLTLYTAATVEPVTLAEARGHCRITSNDEDGLLAGYLIAARTHAEQYTRRALMTQTLDLTLDEDWPRERSPLTGSYDSFIVLPKPPVVSVTSITYVDNAGATQTLAADQYRLVKLETGEHAIVPAYGVTWPSVRMQYGCATVRYVTGYGANPGDAPEPIRHAILMLTAHFYDNREAVNVGNIVTEMPLAVEALLFPYRVFY